ncbi:hypothetical protein [Arthrobacter sp. FW306-04-A]|uniref:hypothetical protein n=1 Tax=Arthrobacter sp. FW306-04-A TaxID=2879619 RepID=UPI0037BFDB50|nr:hypothetical protein LFT43_18830 [Arthrobacter sp. FW306-04-A]
MAMQERTAFDAEHLRQLSKLKLLVNTGMANAAIDLRAGNWQSTVKHCSGRPTSSPGTCGCPEGSRRRIVAR